MAKSPLTGSMFTTSEGLFTTVINGLLANGLMVSDDFRVQIACAIGAALVTSAYILGRSWEKGQANA